MFASLATSAFGKPVEDEKIGNYGSRLAPKWKNQRDGKGNHLLSSKHQCLEPQNGHRWGWIPLLWLQPPEIFLSFTLCCILPLEGAALCWNRVCFGLCSPECWECDQSLQVWSVCLQRPAQSLPCESWVSLYVWKGPSDTGPNSLHHPEPWAGARHCLL